MTVQVSVVFDDPYVGLEGHVSNIDERDNSLRVWVSGSYWPAKKARSCFLRGDSRIRVIARHGITLIIEPAEVSAMTGDRTDKREDRQFVD